MQEYIGRNPWEKTLPYRSPVQPLELLKEYFYEKNVVDLGCGSGFLLKYLETKYKTKKILGIDMEKLESHKFYGINVINADYSTKATFIIAYNTKSFTCSNPSKNNCGLCGYLKGIQSKVIMLKKFLDDNNYSHHIIKSDYKEGTLCRQSGTFIYFIIKVF